MHVSYADECVFWYLSHENENEDVYITAPSLFSGNTLSKTPRTHLHTL